MPYNQYAVYPSFEEDHTRDGGGGMTPFPRFMTCGEPRMFGDLFDVENMHQCKCMEDVLEAAGVYDYHRFICGYHIHRMAKSQVRDDFCVLDWYYQPSALRLKYPDVWDHYLLLDQVSPINFYKATTVQWQGSYVWPNHKIGCDSSWGE